jgi:hypothetical protein
MTLRSAIFTRAFEAIGIAGYVFETTAEEQASAAAILDDMMAQWTNEGIALGYVATGGEPLPDADIETPTWANNAIVYNLALALAPSFGKQVAPHVRGSAKRGYAEVYAKAYAPPTMHTGRIPVTGGGNWWRRVVFR